MIDKQENNNLLFLATLYYLFKKKNIGSKDTYEFYRAFLEKINKPALSKGKIVSFISRLDATACLQKIICRNKKLKLITLKPDLFVNFDARYSEHQEGDSDLKRFLRILYLEAKTPEKKKYALRELRVILPKLLLTPVN